MAALPLLACTPGEPAGVGPDLCLHLAQGPHDFRLVFIADPGMLRQRAAQLGLHLDLPLYAGPDDAPGVSVLPSPLAAPVQAGRLDAANAPYVIATLERAVAGCMSGEFDALVTGPVHKGVINDAGIPFTGHTEFLAQRSGVHQVVMMLTAGTLRVALATTHLPLSAVSAHITPVLLRDVLHILDHDLRARFGLAQPRILVCGLNPHAGESGYLGREEIEVMAPVIDELRHAGMDLRGPLPADTAFTPRQLRDADAVLAMYHDQGLPVLKYAGFGEAVNVTLGLPFVRTSVDHGTALELAGTGRADAGSLLAATKLAVTLIRARTARS